jgi:hypothetical protein
MPKKKSCFCHSCGKRVEYSECPNRSAPPEDARCKALSGWLTVSHWTGIEAVDQYDFCSFSCLQKWVSAQVPGIPQVFFKAFEEK